MEMFGLAAVIGGLLYFAFIIGILALYIYIMVLTIKCLRRGIKALDKYLSKDSITNSITQQDL